MSTSPFFRSSVNYDNFKIAPDPITPAWGDETITENLSVGGHLAISGREVAFGSASGTDASGLLYDNNTGCRLPFDLTETTGAWSWRQGGLTRMTLDTQNRLTLSPSDGTSPPLRLDPLGVSEFASLKVKDALTVAGDLRIAPRGDLSMGAFTAGTPPQE